MAPERSGGGPGGGSGDGPGDGPAGGDEFAPEEIAMLRDFFRDEAHEALEALTAALLGAGATAPDPDTVTELMRTTHTLKGSAGTVGLPAVVDFAHRLEDELARLRTGRLPWSAAALDRFVETVDALRAYIDTVDGTGPREAAAEAVGAQLDAFAALRADRSPAVVPPGPPAGDGEVSDGVVARPAAPGESTRTIIAGEVSGPQTAGSDDGRRDAVLRVDPGRIDQLMDSVGELVFDRTRIERRVQHLGGLARELGQTRERLRDSIALLRGADDPAPATDLPAAVDELLAVEAALALQVSEVARASAVLLDDADALRRTSTALQDGLTRVRMLTARSLFQQLAPPLRAIARSAGKKLRLSTSGHETEFDRTVASTITDPLIQLLRNAVAHGIESGDDRLRAGKPEEGEIRIAARHEGGLVVLEVADDGAGIDPAALRRRFIESGRWPRARADMASDEDVLRAIFDAGVSTRDRADELAGRGVGLDAVRETIARLGGEIRMSSTPGQGTTFTMRLPVSAAVSHALLFKVHGHVYAIPNVHVLETAHVEIEDGGLPARLRVRDDSVPLVCLHRVLGPPLPPGARNLPAVVLEFAGKRLAVTCDKIVGPREIVVKHLGPLLSPLPLYAGATISGSGKVQLILDPAALARLAYPSAAAEAPPPVPAPLGTTGSGGTTLPPLSGRALVADDSRAIREAVGQILTTSGYVVDLAEDGARAWELVRQLRYDIVVTDLEMPRVDGFSLIEKLRADDRLGAIPIIVISSSATEDNLRRAEHLGVRSFVAKPVTRRKVVDALSQIAGD